MIRKIQLIALFIFLGLNLMADPPNPNGSGSGGGPLPGGGAPVDNGIIIFLVVATLYAAYKTYQMRYKKSGYTVVN